MGVGQLGTDSGSPPSGGDFGVFGTAGGASGLARNVPCGVWGDSGDGNGVVGQSGNGAGVGGASAGGTGVSGRTDTGVGVEALSNSGTALHASAVAGGLAAVFDGDTVHNGNLTVAGSAALNAGFVNVSSVLTVTSIVAASFSANSKLFRIDHPVDPANKYLCHSSVESPDMKNVYDGVSALDGRGEAVVELPAWFEALNQDFRYQLTAIGAPGPNLYIAQEICSNRFRIAGGIPGMKVSWQVTGVRHDAYAEAHRVQVEQDKPEAERGYYQHPELYGQPAEKGIEAARQAERMQRRKDLERGPSLSPDRPPVAGDASSSGSQPPGTL